MTLRIGVYRLRCSGHRPERPRVVVPIGVAVEVESTAERPAAVATAGRGPGPGRHPADAGAPALGPEPVKLGGVLLVKPGGIAVGMHADRDERARWRGAACVLAVLEVLAQDSVPHMCTGGGRLRWIHVGGLARCGHLTSPLSESPRSRRAVSRSAPSGVMQLTAYMYLFSMENCEWNTCMRGHAKNTSPPRRG